MAVVPFQGDVFRIRRGDRAELGRVAVKTNASAGFELARLFGCHCCLSSRDRTSTPYFGGAGVRMAPLRPSVMSTCGLRMTWSPLLTPAFTSTEVPRSRTRLILRI